MSKNSESPETYANRVAQFEKEQQKLNAGTKTASAKTVKALDTQNPYLQARLKVLNGYGPERLEIIKECERLGTINTPEYDRFIFDILIAVGDVPTHSLRKRSEQCGCFSCRGKKKK